MSYKKVGLGALAYVPGTGTVAETPPIVAKPPAPTTPSSSPYVPPPGAKPAIEISAKTLAIGAGVAIAGYFLFFKKA